MIADHDATLLTGPAIGPEGSLVERAKSYGYRVEVLDGMRRSHSSRQGLPGHASDGGICCARSSPTSSTHIAAKPASSADGRRCLQGFPRSSTRFTGLAFTASKRRIVNHLYKIAERVAAKWSTKIVCVADAMRDQSLAANIGRSEQYVTVYSGMATGPFLQPQTPRAEIRKSLGVNDDDIVVGTIARLFELKGHDDLLDIAPKLCAEFPNLKFLWVGDGLLRGQFERRMDQMKLRDKIHPDRDGPTCGGSKIHGGDGYFGPSLAARGIGQGAPARIAGGGCRRSRMTLTARKKARSTDKRDMCFHRLVNVKMADAIGALARDPQRRREMGTAGRAFALRRFDAKVMVDELEKVYIDALRSVKK